MEGVQAVVQILRKSQVTGKIPLRVYNRSAGIVNVRFDGKSRIIAQRYPHRSILMTLQTTQI